MVLIFASQMFDGDASGSKIINLKSIMVIFAFKDFILERRPEKYGIFRYRYDRS
jgi:hypothetical protein